MTGPVAATACDACRAALVDQLEGGPRDGRTDDAYDHLLWCEACAAYLRDVALVVIRLRRLGREAAQAQPRPDAWSRLVLHIGRSRAAARRAAWAWRLRLAGTAASAFLVALLVLPASTADGPHPEQSQAAPFAELSFRPAVLEARWLERVRQERGQQVITVTAFEPAPATMPSGPGSAAWLRPDGMVPVRTLVLPPTTLIHAD